MSEPFTDNIAANDLPVANAAPAEVVIPAGTAVVTTEATTPKYTGLHTDADILGYNPNEVESKYVYGAEGQGNVAWTESNDGLSHTV